MSMLKALPGKILWNVSVYIVIELSLDWNHPARGRVFCGFLDISRIFVICCAENGLSSILLVFSVGQDRAREVGFGQTALNRHSCGNVPFEASRTLPRGFLRVEPSSARKDVLQILGHYQDPRHLSPLRGDCVQDSPSSVLRCQQWNTSTQCFGLSSCSFNGTTGGDMLFSASCSSDGFLFDVEQLAALSRQVLGCQHLRALTVACTRVVTLVTLLLVTFPRLLEVSVELSETNTSSLIEEELTTRFSVEFSETE